MMGLHAEEVGDGLTEEVGVLEVSQQAQIGDQTEEQPPLADLGVLALLDAGGGEIIDGARRQQQQQVARVPIGVEVAAGQEEQGLSRGAGGCQAQAEQNHRQKQDEGPRGENHRSVLLGEQIQHLDHGATRSSIVWPARAWPIALMCPRPGMELMKPRDTRPESSRSWVILARVSAQRIPSFWQVAATASSAGDF